MWEQLFLKFLSLQLLTLSVKKYLQVSHIKW